MAYVNVVCHKLYGCKRSDSYRNLLTPPPDRLSIYYLKNEALERYNRDKLGQKIH